VNIVNNFDNEVIKVIKDAVVTVPGVIAFADYTANGEPTNSVDKAVEKSSTDNVSRYRIHVILLNGVNIKDVTSEIQIRMKYELEKMTKFTVKYQVDVVVDQLHF